MSQIELIATTVMGVESVVAYEVKKLGYEPVVENGRVSFIADEAAVCRANLWLRSAERVLIKLGEFPATSFEALFEGTRALPWAEWIPANAVFPVDGRSLQSQLSSVPACQSIVKKAVVEALKQRYGLEWFPENGPTCAITVALKHDVATLTLDTTGQGLHKRGYRKLVAAAPLRETLAAALLQISRWYPDRPFYDLLCGSGTLPIEAALLGHNIAPGLHRGFPAQDWPRLRRELWEKAKEEAYDLADYDADLQITGSDIDPEALALAEHHARSAGLAKSVRFRQAPVAEAEAAGEYGFVITNPPYGERIGERQEVEQISRDLGALQRRLPTWSFGVITAFTGFERLFGKPADKRRKLYNGRIECQYYMYQGPRRPRPPAPDQ